AITFDLGIAIVDNAYFLLFRGGGFQFAEESVQDFRVLFRHIEPDDSFCVGCIEVEASWCLAEAGCRTGITGLDDTEGVLADLPFLLLQGQNQGVCSRRVTPSCGSEE